MWQCSVRHNKSAIRSLKKSNVRHRRSAIWSLFCNPHSIREILGFWTLQSGRSRPDDPNSRPWFAIRNSRFDTGNSRFDIRNYRFDICCFSEVAFEAGTNGSLIFAISGLIVAIPVLIFAILHLRHFEIPGSGFEIHDSVFEVNHFAFEIPHVPCENPHSLFETQF